MAWLPLANLLHYKTRSVLSLLGIAVGICMLITLSGLSRGSLGEIADRWEGVDADLIVYPPGWGENITTLAGIGLSDRYAQRLTEDYGHLVERVVPVFIWQVRLAGQRHTVAGLDSEHWPVLSGGRALQEGRLFDPEGRFGEWLEGQLLVAGDNDEIREVTSGDLARHGGLELVIDSRLARAGGYRVGQTVKLANHQWRIVGIAQAGAMTRVAMPRRTAQYLFASGTINRSTMMFVKLRPGVDIAAAESQLRRLGPDVVRFSEYRGMLQDSFGVMLVYVDIVNAVAMVMAFLFIMVMLYTMVLQRSREIAILKSCGASRPFVLRQVMAESLLLTGMGAGVGVAMSFLAAALINHLRPLLTVRIEPLHVAVALVVAAAGAMLSGLYPAWRASRVDMAEVLSFE